MTTFSTRRRQGFDLPRDEGGGLGVYSLPAPGPVANNSAEQVSRVLAAVGSTFANVASMRRENQAELDRTMLGVAEEVYQSKSAALQSRITNDPTLPIDDDGVSAYVTCMLAETVSRTSPGPSHLRPASCRRAARPSDSLSASSASERPCPAR